MTGNLASPAARSAVMMTILQVRPGSSSTVIHSRMPALWMMAGSRVNRRRVQGAVSAVSNAMLNEMPKPQSRVLRTKCKD